MKKRLLSLTLALALYLCLCTIPVAAIGDMASATQSSPISTSNGVFAIIDENDSLWMWGHNSFGQAGNGGVGDSTYRASDIYFGASGKLRPCQTTPVKVLDDVVSVSCGGSHTAAVKKDGSLWMWGLNFQGQLGNGRQSNKVYEEPAFGAIPYQTIPVKVMDGVVAVSCGEDFTGAITADGTLWMWGSNENGQLGNGKMNTDYYIIGVASVLSDTPIKVLENVSAVSCGSDFTAAIKADRTLWMWGSNVSGQLGNGNTGNVTHNFHTYQTRPVQVEKDVISVSCGAKYTATVKSDGSLWTAGDGYMGILGNGQYKGQTDIWFQTGAANAYTSVSCGNGHGIALSENTAYAWGDNTEGQLGTQNRGSQLTSEVVGLYFYYIASPTKVDSLTNNVTAVSCGSGQTIALRADGTVWVWGYNYDKDLGNGGKSNDTNSPGMAIQTLPSQVPNLKAKQPSNVATPTASYTPPDNTVTFADVPEGQYYTEAVNWAVEKGITSGTSKTTFSPNNTCTKGQIITFLWRAKGEPEPEFKNPWFRDTDRGDYYYKATLWALDMGMAKGIGFLEPFGVNQSCTRAQAVLYIWQAEGSPVPSTKANFADVSTNSDYAQAVAWAVQQGITSGTSAKTFSPNATCTRGQIVTFLYRAMGK